MGGGGGGQYPAQQTQCAYYIMVEQEGLIKTEYQITVLGARTAGVGDVMKLIKNTNYIPHKHAHTRTHTTRPV